MSKKQYTACWISHSSLGDFNKCPKAYYYRNVFKRPENNKKISTVGKYLSLGVAVHNVLEGRAYYPQKTRLDIDFKAEFLKEFDEFRGKKGGFKSKSEEKEFEERGLAMLENVWNNPGPLAGLTIKPLVPKGDLAWVWLSEEEEIIGSGAIDWIEWSKDGIALIDFKTAMKNSEDSQSLQFPMYSILFNHFKGKAANKCGYWYVARDKDVIYKECPSPKESLARIMPEALRLKEARLAKNFKCPYNGCRNCRDYERILKGEGELVGYNKFGGEMYYLD